MRFYPRPNTLYACVLPKPALILYLCNTASPLDATTSIPTHLSQRMDKTTTTSFFSWRGAFQIALAVAAFFMVDPYIRKLLSFVQEHCIAELSPKWFGAFVCLLVACCCYILCRRYKNTYIPVQLRWGLLLLAAAYLYYRISPCYYYRLSPEFYFWRIPIGDCTVFRATWTDLLFLPWLYVMGGRGVLRYLMLNWRFKRMLCRIRGVWSKLKRLCEQKAEVTRQEKKATPSSLSSPIHCAKDDELDFNPKVRKLAKELRELELMGRSTCYGVIAPWGYGKTSFLNLLSKKLSFDGIVVAFNPRSAESAERIQADFFAKLAQELSRYYWGASLVVTRYAEQIGLLNHFSKARLLADVLRLLCVKGDKATVSTAIEKIGKRLYIILDDLDRLEGEELLETIKLIDVNADFKNTVFLVACDKKYANDVLQEYLGVHPSQGYLDKYITREIHLSGYVEEKLAEVMVKFLEEKLQDGELIRKHVILEGWYRIAPYIVSHLGSTRHLKRYQEIFISDFSLKISQRYKVQDYVDPIDFFLLTLLKYKDPGVYDAVKYRICFDDNGPFYSVDRENRWARKNPFSIRNIASGSSDDTSQEDSGPMLSDHISPVVQAAQWVASTEVVYALFDGRDNVVSGQSPKGLPGIGVNSLIRDRRGFTSYFPDLEDEDRESWCQDVLALVQCKDNESGYEVLDRRYRMGDRKAMILLLNKMIESRPLPNEKRETTWKLVAYMADKYDAKGLEDSLMFCLRRGAYTCYEDWGIVERGKCNDFKMKLFEWVVAEYPALAYRCFRIMGGLQPQDFATYIYTKAEVEDHLKDVLNLSLKQYERLFQSGGYTYKEGWVDDTLLDQLERCQNTISGLFSLSSLSCKLAAREFISWVKEHPQQSLWLFLSETDRCPLPVKFNTDLKQAMEANGLSVEEWIDMMDTPETKEVLRVITEDRATSIEADPTSTPRKYMCIPYIYEAFVRSGLIHPGSED